jgi:hypothetical protein
MLIYSVKRTRTNKNVLKTVRAVRLFRRLKRKKDISIRNNNNELTSYAEKRSRVAPFACIEGWGRGRRGRGERGTKRMFTFTLHQYSCYMYTVRLSKIKIKNVFNKTVYSHMEKLIVAQAECAPFVVEARTESGSRPTDHSFLISNVTARRTLFALDAC